MPFTSGATGDRSSSSGSYATCTCVCVGVHLCVCVCVCAKQAGTNDDNINAREPPMAMTSTPGNNHDDNFMYNDTTPGCRVHPCRYWHRRTRKMNGRARRTSYASSAPRAAKGTTMAPRRAAMRTKSVSLRQISVYSSPLRLFTSRAPPGNSKTGSPRANSLYAAIGDAFTAPNREKVSPERESIVSLASLRTETTRVRGWKRRRWTGRGRSSSGHVQGGHNRDIGDVPEWSWPSPGPPRDHDFSGTSLTSRACPSWTWPLLLLPRPSCDLALVWRRDKFREGRGGVRGGSEGGGALAGAAHPVGAVRQPAHFEPPQVQFVDQHRAVVQSEQRVVPDEEDRPLAQRLRQILRPRHLAPVARECVNTQRWRSSSDWPIATPFGFIAD
eukprot:1194034-Prorocentrum_minimum.AAC.2